MNKRLFVGNLCFSTTAPELGRLFETVGPVVNATIVNFRGKSKGYGFVEFAEENLTKKAILSLNNKNLGGRQIHVEFSRDKISTSNYSGKKKKKVEFGVLRRAEYKERHALIVDFNYEIENGFSGLKRNVIFRLLKLFWHKTPDVKAIIGICGSYYPWKHHELFTLSRPKNLPTVFRPNKKGNCKVARAYFGVLCTFNTSLPRTLLLDLAIVKGVFQWKVKINYGKKIKAESYFCIGIAQGIIVSYNGCDEEMLGERAGTCGLSLLATPWLEDSLVSRLLGAGDFRCTSEHDDVAPDGSLVTIELDANQNTLTFFINDKKFPFGVSDIRTPAYMGMSAKEQPSSFTSLFFHRLPAPTPSPHVCTLYTYEDKDTPDVEYSAWYERGFDKILKEMRKKNKNRGYGYGYVGGFCGYAGGDILFGDGE